MDVTESENWLKPEEALTQFKRPDISVIDFEEKSKTGNINRYGFRLGNIGLLIPEGTMSEVMKTFDIYPVPTTQEWFKGLTNLRGNLVPAFDLALLLGLTDSVMAHENLLVLDRGSDSLGILIDNLPRPYDISSWHKLTHPPRIPAGLTEYVTEVYAVDEVIWICIDHKGFFSSIKQSVSM